MKECRTCGEKKPAKEFSRNLGNSDGKQSSCRSCVSEYSKVYYKKNSERIKERVRRYSRTEAGKTVEERRRQRRYGTEKYHEFRFRHRLKRRGWTSDHYDKQLLVQGTICANPGCGEAWKHLDHNHKNMTPRGMLCIGCNLALGGLREDPKKIKGLLQYLKRWESL